jgi:hypothetical protein
VRSRRPASPADKVGGGGSDHAPGARDAFVKESLLRGVAQIREKKPAEKLYEQLVRTLAELRANRVSTRAGRRGRALAIHGLTWTLKGVQVRLDLLRNDSGKLEGAVRDAKRADRCLNRAQTCYVPPGWLWESGSGR